MTRLPLSAGASPRTVIPGTFTKDLGHIEHHHYHHHSGFPDARTVLGQNNYPHRSLWTPDSGWDFFEGSMEHDDSALVDSPTSSTMKSSMDGLLYGGINAGDFGFLSEFDVSLDFATLWSDILMPTIGIGLHRGGVNGTQTPDNSSTPRSNHDYTKGQLEANAVREQHPLWKATPTFTAPMCRTDELVLELIDKQAKSDGQKGSSGNTSGTNANCSGNAASATISATSNAITAAAAAAAAALSKEPAITSINSLLNPIRSDSKRPLSGHMNGHSLTNGHFIDLVRVKTIPEKIAVSHSSENADTTNSNVSLVVVYDLYPGEGKSNLA